MSGLSIFVVDAHDVMRQATVMALRSMDHTVASARALDDELNVVSTDILLLSLPNEDGLSQVRSVRGAHPAMGIIAITPGAQADEPGQRQSQCQNRPKTRAEEGWKDHPRGQKIVI